MGRSSTGAGRRPAGTDRGAAGGRTSGRSGGTGCCSRGGAIVVVVAVVLALVLRTGGNGGSGLGTAGGARPDRRPSLTALTAQVTSVPAATLDQVGGGHGDRAARPRSPAPR